MASLFLIHSFLDTSKLNLRPPPLATLQWLPDFLIRGIIRSVFPRGRTSSLHAKAAEFAIAQTLAASREKLASRLALSASTTSLVGRLLPETRITLLDTLDRAPAALSLSDLTAEQLPGARRALLNTGADFPYLSVPDDVNIHLLVHLRRCAPKVEEKACIPPPARPRKAVEKPVETTKKPEKGRTRADAEAVVAAEGKAKVEKYAFEIARLRDVLPERDDLFLAAIMDKAEDLEEALQKVDEGLYDDTFYVNAFNEAVESAMKGENEESEFKESSVKITLEAKEESDEDDTTEKSESYSPLKAELSPVASPEAIVTSPRRKSGGEDELVGRGPTPFGGAEGEWVKQPEIDTEGEILFEWKGVFGDGGDAESGNDDTPKDEWDVFRSRNAAGVDPLDAKPVEIREEVKPVAEIVDELVNVGLHDEDDEEEEEEDSEKVRLRAWSMSATAASKTILR